MRLAIITDIHEDILSLREALSKIERLKCDDIICLGDISGFSLPYYSYYQSRNAHECLNLIRNNCKYIILGNHDIHAAQIIPEHCSFFDYPKDWYELNYHQRHELGNHILWLHEENDLNPLYKKKDIEFLKTLPEYIVYETPEIKLLFTHYVYPNISGLKKEFYTYGDEYIQHFKFMKSLDCDISFTGHSHMKGVFIVSNNIYKEYKYKKLILKNKPVCVGIPPVTRSNKKNGFCIFDTTNLTLQAIRI